MSSIFRWIVQLLTKWRWFWTKSKRLCSSTSRLQHPILIINIHRTLLSSCCPNKSCLFALPSCSRVLLSFWCNFVIHSLYYVYQNKLLFYSFSTVSNWETTSSPLRRFCFAISSLLLSAFLSVRGYFQEMNDSKRCLIFLSILIHFYAIIANRHRLPYYRFFCIVQSIKTLIASCNNTFLNDF